MKLRPIRDPNAVREALPRLVRRFGKANGCRCVNCGAALYGRQRLYCGKLPGAYDCQSEFDPRIGKSKWWKDAA